jgi:(p)ppGpp synthase/HD superfamily hydrolase
MNTDFWPYLELSRILSHKKRKGTGNMFRHQLETFAILLEYGYKDPILLKAAIIHDLIEDGQKVGFTNFESIITADEDGKEVYDLVKEVSIRVENNTEEPKEQFLERIMQNGSQKAKVLKLADRLSNIISLSSANDIDFVQKYIEETNLHIMPYADEINKDIAGELKNSLMVYEQ